MWGGPVPVEAVPAGPMDAGVATALVDLGQAGGVVVALGAAAGEAVDAVLAGAAVVTGVVRALIDVDMAHAPCGRGDGAAAQTLTPTPPEGEWVPDLGASVSPSVKPPPQVLPRHKRPPTRTPLPGPKGRAGRGGLRLRTPWTPSGQRAVEGSTCAGSLALLWACWAGFDQEREPQGCPSGAGRSPDPSVVSATVAKAGGLTAGPWAVGGLHHPAPTVPRPGPSRRP